jgi:hypothetical protein
MRIVAPPPTGDTATGAHQSTGQACDEPLTGFSNRPAEGTGRHSRAAAVDPSFPQRDSREAAVIQPAGSNPQQAPVHSRHHFRIEGRKLFSAGWTTSGLMAECRSTAVCLESQCLVMTDKQAAGHADERTGPLKTRLPAKREFGEDRSGRPRSSAPSTPPPDSDAAPADPTRLRWCILGGRPNSCILTTATVASGSARGPESPRMPSSLLRMERR